MERILLRQISHETLVTKFGLLLVFIISVLLSSCSDQAQQKEVFTQHGDTYEMLVDNYQLQIEKETIQVLPTEATTPVSMTLIGDLVSSQAQLNKGIFQKEVYEDIAVQLTSRGGTAAYDFILEAGSDVSAIAIQVDAAAYLSEEGDVLIPTQEGVVRHSAPISYQEIDGEHVAVESEFVLADATLGFELGEYNSNYTLIIDPTITFEPSTAAMLPPACSGSANTVAGFAWADYNYDGVKDANETIGLPGITVRVFDEDGSQIGTDQTTDADGNWSLDVSAATSTCNTLRVEYSGLPSWASSTQAGADNGTTVQFVSPGDCANLGVASPLDFCEDDPLLAIPCYLSDDAGDAEGAVVSFRYSVGGPDATSGQSGNYDEQSTVGLTGATYGVAHQRTSETVFTSAYFKIQADYGTGGTGAIYALTEAIENPPTEALFLDLNAVTGFNGAGADTHVPQGQNGAAFFDQTADNTVVGKISLGDLEISDDDQTLFTVNMNTGELVVIPIGLTPTAPTTAAATDATPAAGEIGQFTIPNPCNVTSDGRPMGLAYHEGLLYVGGVCSAESTVTGGDDDGDPTQLSLYIYTFDVATNSFSAAPVYTAPLNYDRTSGGPGAPVEDFREYIFNDRFGNPVPGTWRVWGNNQPILNGNFDTQSNPMPMLSDIEFDVDGSLILGLRDRWGDMGLVVRTSPGANPNPTPVAGGDLLRAAPNGTGGWTAPIDNPNGDGFYFEDNYLEQHGEITLGSMALLPGKDEVVVSVYDPFAFQSGGVEWYSNADGSYDKGFELYAINAPNTFAKGNGLGDIEALCGAAPIEIGNYVWNDADNDGIQDACEMGIDGVEVELVKDGTVIATTTTANGGQYYFSDANATDPNLNWTGTGDDASLQPNTQYVINIPDAEGGSQQASLMDLSLTTQDENNPANDNIDSDGSLNGTDAQITYTTGNIGQIDHTLDFGFNMAPPEPILGAIGNYVWVDEDSDGFQDEGEPGIPNVAVVLYGDPDGDGTVEVIATTYTDSDGKYLFPDLPEGTYYVDVLDGTSGTGNTLPNSALSQTNIFTNVTDADGDGTFDEGDLGNKDHNTTSIPDNVGFTGYQIDLDPGEENLTADFGYNYNPTQEVNDPTATGGSETAALGDRVWIDSDGDGVQDPNEIGVSGVEITLFEDADGDGIYDDVVATTTTDENGYYLFDNLPPGAYTTQVTDDDGASHDVLDDTMYNQTGDPDDFGDPATMPDNQQTDPIVLGPGDVYLNSDYGYQPDGATLGSIGNTVWLDADADGNGPSDSDPDGDGDNGVGTQDDDDEQPIEGVSVSLIKDTNGDGVWNPLGADGVPGTADDEPIIATDVTDENGNYLFEDLPIDDGDGDADYIVWVNDTDNVLDGLEATFDEDSQTADQPDATGVGNDAATVLGMSAVELDSGTPDDRDQDFGYTPAGNEPGEGYIGDFVWFDANDSGGATADMGEAGIEGVVMELLDVNGNVIATTTTDENGFYLFGGLPLDDGIGASGADYTVQVASSNFDPMGVLEGLATTYEPGGGDQDDNQGSVVTLTTGMPGDLDQDFSYTGDDTQGTLGSIGSTIWEDTDNDGIYEPDGVDGMMGTADDETPFEGVTVDLIRDLNGNGQIDPGEPVISTATTDADGNYLFENLPMDDYIVDVTDEDDVLAGYFSSPSPTTDANNNTTGTGDTETADDAMGTVGGDQSKPDAFAVTLDDDSGTADVVNNLNVDFGYYKDPAAVGNYVWVDTDGNGLQDDGETGLNGVEVTLTIEYPDGTMVTLVTTTMNDADGNPGFYEFPNLLLDEDYNTGAVTDPAAEGQPLYTISVDPNQTVLTDNGLIPTMTDVNSNGNDLEDSDDFAGVVAIPFQGSEDTSAQDPETNENPIASYDFGITPSLSIGSTVFSDAENDGLLNNADAGIDGVTVNLNQIFGVDANGNVDINNDGVFDANDDGFLNGFLVIDGQIDTNRDGVVDGDDDGVIMGTNGNLTVVDGQLSGVAAGADQTFQVATQMTSGGGNYFFNMLFPGDYQVEIPTSNFMMGTGALAGLPASSTPTVETDAGAANIDNDDNGIQAGGSGTTTVSPTITLSVGDEPTDGGTETGQANDQDDAADANGDMTIDFGFIAPVNDLATTIVLVPNSDTNGDGQYEIGETAAFTFTVFNQGTTPASDVTITNYVPNSLTPPADGTSGITNITVLDANGTPRVVPVTITKTGDEYDIDFGDDPANWLQPGEQIAFEVEYTINEGDATDTTGDAIVNIIEISEFDVNNDGTGDADVDSTPDATDDDNFGENPRDNNNDNVIDEDAVTNPTTDDEDDHDFAEITAENVLPVELLGFSATAKEDHIALTWSTASELNNSHFELERSEDAKVFKPIERIEGQGTTLETTTYGYEDKAVVEGVVYYYRLKQVDVDGTFAYSDVRSAQLSKGDKEWTIYPNPIGSNQTLQVEFYSESTSVDFYIIDVEGKNVLQVTQDVTAVGWQQISIDVSALPSGQYTLIDGRGNVQQFIKSNE